MLEGFDSGDTGTMTPSLWTSSGFVTIVSPGRKLPDGRGGAFAWQTTNNEANRFHETFGSTRIRGFRLLRPRCLSSFTGYAIRS